MNTQRIKILRTLLDDGEQYGLELIDKGCGSIGDIYGALDRMESAGDITSKKADKVGDLRRLYSITGKGRYIVENEKSNWNPADLTILESREANIGLTINPDVFDEKILASLKRLVDSNRITVEGGRIVVNT